VASITDWADELPLATTRPRGCFQRSGDSAAHRLRGARDRRRTSRSGWPG